MGPSTEHYGANSTTPRTSFNDVASLISESLIRPISRGTTAEEDGKGNGRPLTFMEIDEALEYGRLKQRYDMRGKENMSDVEGDLLRVGGEGKEWAGICNEQDLLRCLESWDRTHEGAYLGLFLRNVKIFTVQLKVVKKLAEVLQIPWKFLSSVLLRQASRSSVYVRRNSDGEEELVSYSTSKNVLPDAEFVSECLITNLSRKTAIYLSINYPEFILDDFRKLLDADASASAPALICLLPQFLLARAHSQDIDTSRRHASRLLYSYESDYSSDLHDQNLPVITEKTHHFLWELHRTTARVRRYIEYLTLLLNTARLLNRNIFNSSSSSTALLSSEFDLRALSTSDHGFDTQAIPYVTRLISEAEVLTDLFGNYIRRTKILINQIFHYSAQKDRLLNIRMAEQSAQIAIDTRQDSYAMRTISILTMLFLPGTFISALFGMNFFSQPEPGENGGFAVGENLWLYFALTVPLTALVFAVWWWWLKRGVRRAEEANERLEEAREPSVELRLMGSGSQAS